MNLTGFRAGSGKLGRPAAEVRNAHVPGSGGARHGAANRAARRARPRVAERIARRRTRPHHHRLRPELLLLPGARTRGTEQSHQQELPKATTTFQLSRASSSAPNSKRRHRARLQTHSSCCCPSFTLAHSSCCLPSFLPRRGTLVDSRRAPATRSLTLSATPPRVIGARRLACQLQSRSPRRLL
jgi:hypothetical protein